MIILLRIIGPQRYTQIDRHSRFELYYKGRFHSHNEAIQYISEHEMTENIISHDNENGICVCTVGDIPTMYIILDVLRLSDVPQLVGQFSISA